MKVVVIPEMTTIHIPIITIGLKIIPSIYLLIIFIPKALHKKSLLHVMQLILNTTKTIIEAICEAMYKCIQYVIQCVKQLGFE